MSLADFAWYRGDLPWLPARTVFLTRHGSHAYGTALPTSDLDLKGLAIAPRAYYLGVLHSFEQAEVREPIDAVVYDIRKFWRLASDCNPNIIEVLFTDPSDWVLPAPDATDSAWHRIQEHRDLFLSRKARHTFSGYAIAQLKRIQTHRAWLLDPPAGKPERADFGLSNTEGALGREQLGLIESRVHKIGDTLAGTGLTRDQVDERGEDLVVQAVTDLNLARAIIPIVIAERRYAAASRNWDAYERWKAERNPKRAALEAAFGYDTKHAMHLVRLLRMAREILAEGKVIVKRPDAEELLRIRAGGWSYGELIEWARAAEQELEPIAARSPLPQGPDRTKLDDLLVGLVQQAIAS